MKYKRAAHYIYFLFSRCYVYIMLPIWCKSWNRVYWLLLFLIRIKFGHAQISVPKIGVPISKIACINPTGHKEKHIEKDKCLGEILNDARQKNINQPIIGQLNINSIRNKFHFLESEASKHLDILLISETKIDESFPSAQFLLDGFSRPYRLDRCANGGGILLYVRDDISSCLLTEYKLQDNTECLFIEINIRKKKWLFCCSYNPNKNNISKHLHCLSKGLDTYISQYDNIMLLGAGA